MMGKLSYADTRASQIPSAKMSEDLCQLLKSDTLQDIITEVGKSQPSTGDKKVEAIIN